MRRVLVALAIAVGVVLGGVVVLGLLVSALGGIHSYVIPSSAMEPTLHCARPATGCRANRRDRVLGVSWGVSYGRGDIVVFKTPTRAEIVCGVRGKFVKRIVALPGERVQIRRVDGADETVVDGKPLDEPYVKPGRRSNDPTKTYVVPEDSYFLLGDNRTASCDSRHFGSVSKKNLEARVVLVYWPLGRIAFR
jgi:signal peptidase I